MDRLNAVRNSSKYKLLLGRINENEADRKFCRHGIEHCLNVARIAYIMNLEQKLHIPKEIIYTASLLHDIGRADNSISGKNHQELSCIYAEDIMKDCGFDENEIEIVLEAIAAHNTDGISQTGLPYLLYKADKLSRNCFDCDMYQECYWETDAKNHVIRF